MERCDMINKYAVVLLLDIISKSRRDASGRSSWSISTVVILSKDPAIFKQFLMAEMATQSLAPNSYLYSK